MAGRSMNSPRDSQDLLELDARIARALESAPRPEIPAGFAARMAAQAPPGQIPSAGALTLAPSQYGRNAAVACVAVLLALIFLVARHTGNSPVWISIESLLSLQLALIAIGLTARGVWAGLGWFS